MFLLLSQRRLAVLRNAIFYCSLILMAAGSSSAMTTGLTPDEEKVFDYLKTLNFRYPKWNEEAAITECTIFPFSNFKAEAYAFLDEHKKQNKDDISCYCATPAKFFVYLLHGDSIRSLHDFYAYSGSPHVAYIGPRDSVAHCLLNHYNTVNCGIWLARTSQGWLGLSSRGLLILSSQEWIKLVVAGLKSDYEHVYEKRFDNEEKSQIMSYRLLEENSWGLREKYELRDDVAGKVSASSDVDWPNKKCEELFQLIKSGKLSDFDAHF